MFLSFQIKLHNELKVIYGQFLANKNLFVFLKIQKLLFIKFLKRRFWIKKIYKNNRLNENDLRSFKKSDTLFVFGSGQSLNEISNDEFAKIDKEDTIGFNHTILLNKIYFTYHLHRGGTTRPGAIFFSKDYCNYFVKKISNNKFYKDTIFLFAQAYTSDFTNELIGSRLFPKFFQLLFIILIIASSLKLGKTILQLFLAITLYFEYFPKNNIKLLIIFADKFFENKLNINKIILKRKNSIKYRININNFINYLFYFQLNYLIFLVIIFHHQAE